MEAELIKAKANKIALKYYYDHREFILAKKKEAYQANKELLQEKSKANYQKNKTELLSKSKNNRKFLKALEVKYGPDYRENLI